MRILLSEESRNYLFSELRAKYGSYDEAARRLKMTTKLGNWVCGKCSIPEEDFHRISKEASVNESSLSFERTEGRQVLVARRRFPPNPDMAKNYVQEIERFNQGLTVDEFLKLPKEKFLEIDPEVIKMLFSAGRYHFGAVLRLSKFLNINEGSCWDYLTSGVTQIQAGRISPLIQLLKKYNLSKVPCSISEETEKDFVSVNDVKHFIRYGIKGTTDKTPRRILETYSRIYEHGEISFPELVRLNPEPVKITKIKYIERAIKHLKDLGLVKQYKKYSDSGGNFIRVFSPAKKLSPDKFAFVVANYDKMSPKELGFLIENFDNISKEKVNRLFKSKLGSQKRVKAFKEIEKNLFSSEYRQNVKTAPFESVPKTVFSHTPTFLSVSEFFRAIANYLGLKAKDALKFYKTVGSDMEDFEIKYEDDQFVAIPQKTMRSKHLEIIANSNFILIRDGIKLYLPKGVPFKKYRYISQIAHNLKHSHRP